MTTHADYLAWRQRRQPVRDCGARHLGACWTERFRRWSMTGYVPPEYRAPGSWYRVGPDGRIPLPCAQEGTP